MDLHDALIRRWTPSRANDAIHAFSHMVRDIGGLLDGPRRYGSWDLGAWTGGHEWLGERLKHLQLAISTSISVGKARPFFETQPHDAAPVLERFVADLYLKIRPEATYFVDDTPDLGPYGLSLQRVFPRALVIHMVRDPRDVVASLMAVREKAGWPADTAEQNGRRVVAVLERCELTGHTLMVRLEDLVASPLAVLRRVCGGTDIDPDGPMAAVVDREAAHIGRWRKAGLNKATLAILQPALERWGYT